MKKALLKCLVITIIASFIVCAVSIYCISPIIKQFPKPTGNYTIGTFSLEFVDKDRSELFSSENHRRKLMVRFWYPADVTDEEKYYYLDEKLPYFQKLFSHHYHVPVWLSKLFLGNIATHAYKNAPVTPGKYPVILFSHGLLGFPSDGYVVLIENLVSHGYIVAAIDHSYFNMLTLFPDGTTITNEELASKFPKMSQQEQKDFQAQAIEMYKKDMMFIIDQLVLLNEDQQSKLYQHLDVDHIGIMGHSAGGTAALETCRVDKRCKAVIDLDGWYDHVIGYEPLDVPTLLMFGQKSIEVTEPTAAYLQRKGLTREQYFERERAIAEHKKKLCQAPFCSMIVIPDAEHGDFSDEVLFKWPFRSWSARDSYQLISEINEHILAFLDNYLLG